MVEIELGKGNKAIIDDEDYSLTIGLLWRRRCNGYVGAYLRGRTRPSKNISLHRLVMGVLGTRLHIDHISGDKLDNRKCNLRIATRAQNLANQRIRNQNKSSMFKGVSFNKEKN